MGSKIHIVSLFFNHINYGCTGYQVRSGPVSDRISEKNVQSGIKIVANDQITQIKTAKKSS